MSDVVLCDVYLKFSIVIMCIQFTIIYAIITIQYSLSVLGTKNVLNSLVF